MFILLVIVTKIAMLLAKPFQAFYGAVWGTPGNHRGVAAGCSPDQSKTQDGSTMFKQE